MDNTQKLFLSLIKKYLTGAPAEDCPGADTARLFSLASAQKVMPWIYTAASGEDFFTALDPKAQSFFKQNALAGVVKQASLYAEFLKHYSALTAAGIKPTVQKGIICDLLYPQRDLRPTSDCDLLITPAEFEKSRDILLNNGLNIVSSNTHETSFRSANGLLTIELHTSLFGDEIAAGKTMERFFASHADSDITVKVDSTEITTFCPTLHLLFIVCHALKHFAHSGFGIRQLCDIALFSSVHSDEIDWPLFFEKLGEINASVFYLNLEAAGEAHLGIVMPDSVRREVNSSGDIDPGDLVEDLLDAGIYGSGSAARVHSSNITLDAMRGGGKASGTRASLFPKAEYMKSVYPFLVKFPFLLPLAWLLRILRFLFGKKEKGGSPSAAEVISIGSRRTDLLRKYHLIE